MRSQPAKQPGLPRAGVLESGWWAPGLALSERPLPSSDPVPLTQQARDRIARWHAAYGSRFTDRLAAAGLDETTLRHLVAESPAELAARTEHPAWANTVEHALLTARPVRVDEPNRRAAFAVPLRPFVAVATADLITRVDAVPADVPAIAVRFARRLSRRLVGIAGRTLVHELITGSATSANDLATRLTEPAALAAFLSTYPVLARLLAQVSTDRADAITELLTRFAADRATIVDILLDGADPGTLTEIETGAGDTHRRGRSVTILSFADGRRVVYKPHDLAVHQRFTDAVHWVNRAVPDLELRPVPVVTRDGYGWLAYVPSLSLPLAVRERFRRRQGALLALLHALRAADFRQENVIACGDQPVLVDVETLFHPSVVLGDDTDPATRLLSDSVPRTGLMPEDLGHDEALLDGFRVVYDTITRHRAEFATLLETFANVEVRVVVRQSRDYRALLDETTRPELLRDALDRDAAFDPLWTESAHHPLRWRVCRHEQNDLWAMDIPLFTTKPASADVWSSGGHRMPGALTTPDLATARDRLAAMGDADRRDQEWIVSATLATRAQAGGHRAVPARDRLAGTEAPPERLLAAACELADQIVARGLEDGERVNWLGVERVDDQRWAVRPMGAGLASGYVGVALFLAQVAELSEIARYGDVARRALHAVPPMFGMLAERPDLVATVGCGGLNGFGGIAYGLARLTTLLADDDLRATTRTAVELATQAALTPGAQGIATGDAGCLAAMTAVHAELGLSEAAVLADDRAKRLADMVSQTGSIPGGFACGAAGVAWALSGRDTEAAELARSHARSAPGDLGWCAGLAGLAVAAAADPAPLLTNRPVLTDLSLCHGELGIAEALTVLAMTGDRPEPLAAARRRRAGLVLDAIHQYGASCGVPGGVPTPGLLSGLAGIGYGLLRLGFAERVPSALLFEPSRPRQTRAVN